MINHKLLLGGLILTLAGGVNTASYAQGGMLEEIVVTARKRAESLSDIPESISAFSETDIQNAGIESIKDFIALTPNLIAEQSFRLGVVNLSSRGLETPQQGDTAVVVNFDGVQAPAQDFINQDLFDIERIEVLKGPQGSLYGQGAIGGAINIITKKPTNEYEAKIKARAGNGEAYRVVGTASGPVVEDKLFFRLAGVYQDREGYINNRVRGDKADPWEEYIIRGSLLAEINALTIDLRASFTDTEAGASYYDAIPFLDLTNRALGGDTSQLTFSNNSNLPTAEVRQILTTSLKMDYETDYGTFTSVTGYNRNKEHNLGDLDFRPTETLFGNQDVRFNVEVWNQEFRFSSNEDQNFRWVTGVFLQDREVFNQFDIATPSVAAMANPPTVYDSSNYDFTNLVFSSRDTIDNFAWGVFFHSNWDIRDDLTLTVGLRYDEDERDSAYVGDPAISATAAGLINDPERTVSETFKKLQPKVNLAYQISDDVLIYADYARGFRAGSVNPLTSAAGLPQVPRVLRAEIADNYELGIKTSLADGRVTANATIFHTDIENRHHFFFGSNLQNMINIPESEVDGAEIDIAALIMDGLTWQVAFGILSTEITSFSTDPTQVGNTLPVTPESTFVTSLVYERQLTGTLDLFARAAYRRLGRVYFETQNFISTPASEFIDLRLGVKGENWDITGFIDNATDERRFTSYADTGTGFANHIPNLPRVYGVEASYSF